MIYVQTTIEITEDLMERMTENVLEDLEDTINDRGFPATKEVKMAVLKETLKILIKKELDN